MPFYQSLHPVVAAMDADLLGLGRHCHHSDCHQLDFLPFRCNKCSRVYCLEHRRCQACSSGADDETTVLLCPLCAKAIKVIPGQDPELIFDM